MKKLILLLLLIFAVNLPAVFAQQYNVELSVEGGFPQGSFKENLDRNGIGIEGIMAYSVPSTPLFVGVDMAFYNYGSQRRNEAFNPNIPEVTVRVRTDNNIFTGHFFTRLQNKQGIVRPYMDALIGLSYLFTESRITDDDEYETLASTTNFDDTAFSYGLRGGVQFKVADFRDATGHEYSWIIDLKARYLVGGEAEYLKKGALRNNDGNLEFDTQRSSTNLLSVGLGIGIMF